VDFDVTFKKENGSCCVVDVVTATAGQGFPPVESPISSHPPEEANRKSRAKEV
jgi:hypothetical protein